MSWTLSRFRAGDWVEVRSKDELLATLDADGCIDGMPFMPEMLAFCGKSFRVAAVAHKSCDTVLKTWAGRRMDETVHLEGLRCDGSAHGGCQADCNLFWKDAWLKPATNASTKEGWLGSKRSAAPSPSTPSDAHQHPCAEHGAGCGQETPNDTTIRNARQAGGCAALRPQPPVSLTEGKLHSLTQLAPLADGSACWSCQATRHFDATKPLPWWDVRQYLRDIRTRNHSVRHVVRVLGISFVKHAFQSPRIGYRFFRALRSRIHKWVMGRDVPDIQPGIPRGQPTPTGRLNLRPGEYVRIKTKKEIEKTINDEGKNRGLSFDEEMTRFCGRVFQVRSVVTQIIDEPTGKMIPMKQPCITLQGVVCNSEYSACRLMCPRAIPSYWRELWLERVETSAATDPAPTEAASC